MTIERKTVLHSVLLDRFGNIEVKLGMLIVEGDEQLDCKWHRLAAGPQEDLLPVLAAVVEDLADRGLPPMGDADMAKIIAVNALR